MSDDPLICAELTPEFAWCLRAMKTFSLTMEKAGPEFLRYWTQHLAHGATYWTAERCRAEINTSQADVDALTAAILALSAPPCAAGPWRTVDDPEAFEWPKGGFLAELSDGGIVVAVKDDDEFCYEDRLMSAEAFQAKVKRIAEIRT